jgi:hypothetical protein
MCLWRVDQSEKVPQNMVSGRELKQKRGRGPAKTRVRASHSPKRVRAEGREWRLVPLERLVQLFASGRPRCDVYGTLRVRVRLVTLAFVHRPGPEPPDATTRRQNSTMKMTWPCTMHCEDEHMAMHVHVLSTLAPHLQRNTRTNDQAHGKSIHAIDTRAAHTHTRAAYACDPHPHYTCHTLTRYTCTRMLEAHQYTHTPTRLVARPCN